MGITDGTYATGVRWSQIGEIVRAVSAVDWVVGIGRKGNKRGSNRLGRIHRDATAGSCGTIAVITAPATENTAPWRGDCLEQNRAWVVLAEIGGSTRAVGGGAVFQIA